MKQDVVLRLADVVAGIQFVYGNEYLVLRENVLINSNVLRAAIEENVPKFIYAGTACSYPIASQSIIGGSP